MLQYPTLANKTEIHSEYLNENILNLLDTTFQFPSSEYSFNVFKVTHEYIARPDLISADAYGDDMFADIICKINGISNPFEMNEGMILVIPAAECIMSFISNPQSGEDEITPSNKPKAKAPNQKRKPNEAVIGDSRFKIDKGSKIIIY